MNGIHPEGGQEEVIPPYLPSDNLSRPTPGSEAVGGGKVDRGRLGPALVADVVCDATAKSTGLRCGNPAVRGSTKCRMHGGSSLRGIAAPAYRHGRYSKHLPTHLRQSYEEAREDEQLLSGREEVALLSARIADLTARLHFGDSGSLWQDLRGVYDELQKAMAAGELDRVTSCLLSMGKVIKSGNDNEGMWEEIRETCETLNRVRAAENKRQVDLKQLIAAPQAIALMMAVVQIVQRNVSDVRVLNNIQREVTLLLDTEAEEEGETAQPNPADHVPAQE